jgi:catechol 2,3-dioxygenase-like lactoylglutathione lyase family enzyme
MTSTAAVLEERETDAAEATFGPESTIRRNTTREDDASRADMTPADNPVRHIHHHAYACWDSEETRHFYEDILGMPLIATVVLEDPLRNDGSRYCHMFFEIADGDALAFYEHTSLVHPKRFAARSGVHHHIALEVEGDAMVRQLKCKLDAVGVANVLMDHGAFLTLRFNDPNGLELEFMANVPPSLEYERTSQGSAHSVLQQWLHYRQNWWRNAARMK